jgi:hypothetical protein
MNTLYIKYLNFADAAHTYKFTTREDFPVVAKRIATEGFILDDQGGTTVWVPAHRIIEIRLPAAKADNR